MPIPETTLDGIKNWVELGVPPGGFLHAVFCNDLMESFGRADMWNREAMFEIVSYLYNKCPYTCWGSPEEVRAWATMHADRREQEKEKENAAR